MSGWVLVFGICEDIAIACGVLGKWPACLVFTALGLGVFTWHAVERRKSEA